MRSPASECLDCRNRATPGSKYCQQHQTHNLARTQEKLYDHWRQDDPIRALYRCSRWRAVRRLVIRRDILCTACGHRAGTDVDHILSARIVVDNFGVDEFYNPERLTLLCHGCHSSKTAMECGWTGHRGTKLEQLGDRRQTTVVCGLPCSGKTTYVLEHRQADDLVWDYDEVMAEITGLPLHESLPNAIGSVLAKRDQFLESTQYSKQHVWIIVNNPKAVIVTMLVDAGAQLVVLDTPDEIRERRLAARRAAS